ncbi:carboxypeptidase regulatory-like domain-containing protein [Cytophagaceae bacterium ABcell3]|nr:carboxypeptidase regulatory-like domain-containing protein [Cytophagaceae bacterium ABcell3]
MKKLLLVSVLAVLMMSFQIFPISLKITIRDELGNLTEGATVTLYKTEEDYINKENPVGSAELTNQKGIASFKNLEPAPYFIYAEKGEMNNIERGVQTDTLQKGRVNKATIIID